MKREDKGAKIFFALLLAENDDREEKRRTRLLTMLAKELRGKNVFLCAT